jgi:broad-specificity NMP kinase
MKLVFIYGAPGTGKLTVARELAARTGFRLFHNHLTVDLARTLFEYDTPEYLEYVRFLRRDAFERAVQNDVNLIFTFWYSKESAPSVQRYTEIIERNGGEVVFVKLYCPPEILEQRVQNPERKNWKISNLQSLKNALENTDLNFVIPGTRLIIDNSDLEPGLAAKHIQITLQL